MMELRSPHRSRCGFEGYIKECTLCAYSGLINASVDHSSIVVVAAAVGLMDSKANKCQDAQGWGCRCRWEGGNLRAWGGWIAGARGTRMP